MKNFAENAGLPGDAADPVREILKGLGGSSLALRFNGGKGGKGGGKPGPQGPQGAEGPQGAIGPEGPQGPPAPVDYKGQQDGGDKPTDQTGGISPSPLPEPGSPALRMIPGVGFASVDVPVTPIPKVEAGKENRPDAPTGPLDAQGKPLLKVPPLPDSPPHGKPPAYPDMADPGTKPGWKLVTAGSEYRYVGGDSSRIVVGDRRSIVGGMDVTHVSGNRKTEVGGIVENIFYSGQKTETFGAVETIVHGGPQTHTLEGDQKQAILGNQEVRITGSRNVTSLGMRWEKNTGGRMEFWSQFRKEIGAGLKTEIVGGKKSTLVGGMKVDSVDGYKVDLGKVGTSEKTMKLQWDIKGIAKRKAATDKAEAEKIEQKASSELKNDTPKVVNTGNTETQGDAKVDGNTATDTINVGNGDITNK